MSTTAVEVSGEDHVPVTVHRALAVGVVLICLGATLFSISPEWGTDRICRCILPDGADRAYAKTLLRALGACGGASGLLLVIWWRAAGTLSYAFLRRWSLSASVAIYLVASLSLWGYVNDDAGISFSYARNLASGNGLVLNPGDAPVEGYSNPLWVLIMSAGDLCGLDILYTAKILGVVLGVACVILVYWALREQHPLALLALPLVVGNASFIIWNNSGLENALHALLLLILTLLLGAELPLARPRAGLIAVLCLLVLSRPEGALFAVVTAAFLALRSWRQQATLWPAVVTLVVAGAVLAGLTAFRLLYFDDILPNTFYAKASDTNPLRLLNPFSGGWRYVAQAAVACGWTLAVVPLLLLCVFYKRWAPFVSGALIVLAAQLFFVVSVGGDWMAQFRFMAPVVPIVSILIAIGLVQLWDILPSTLSRGLPACAALCLGPVMIICLSQIPQLIIFAHRPTTSMDVVANIAFYFKGLAQRGGIKDPTMLYHDVGGSTYVARIRLIDLAGLCDRTIAKRRHDRELIGRYIFHENRPTFIYSARTFSDRIGLEEFAEFQADYVPLPPPPSPALDGYIRRVRREVYPDIFCAGSPRACVAPAEEYSTD